MVSVCRKSVAFSMQIGLLMRTRNGQCLSGNRPACVPTKKPGDRPYLEYVCVMTEHHNILLEIQRYTFHSHFQLPDKLVVTVPSIILHFLADPR